jgi:hypothetical protein
MYYNGDTIDWLPNGIYTVSFTQVPGWIAPNPVKVYVKNDNNGVPFPVSVNYQQVDLKITGPSSVPTGGSISMQVTAYDNNGKQLNIPAGDFKWTWKSTGAASVTISPTSGNKVKVTAGKNGGDVDITVTEATSKASGTVSIYVGSSYTIADSSGKSFVVDDDLDVYLNGAQIYTDGTALSGTRAAITLKGNKGDVLEFQVRDTYGFCSSLSSLYLFCNASGKFVMADPGFNLGCGRPGGNNGIVHTHYFKIPAIPGC